VLDRFGYRDAPADSVGEVFIGDDYLRWARKQPQAGRWAQLSSGRVPVIGFWYRTSPRLLIPQSENRFPSLTDPPFRLVGMTETLVDSRGALVEFHAVPPQRTPGQPVANPPATSQPAAAIDWQIVFDAVRWPRDRFTPATPSGRRSSTPTPAPPGPAPCRSWVRAAAPRGRQLRRPPGVRADGRPVDQGVARRLRIEVLRAARPGPVPGGPDPEPDPGVRHPRTPQQVLGRSV
jgi:hypothetical protein